MSRKKNAEKKQPLITRRSFFINGIRTLLGAGAGALALGAFLKSGQPNLRWQLDPDKCIQCGRCETNCVLFPSAVKCVHAYEVCGYCDLCSGYFKQNALSLETGAENRLCPAKAIKRTFVEDPYYEYVIDKDLCIGCGKCVKGCQSFGNGSLFLQVMHDRCVNCNDCSIARNCPAGAYSRVPAESPYLLKGKQRTIGETIGETAE